MIVNLKVDSTERLPPDDEKAGDIFSRLGYRFADALADLVDNSVDAEASNVHIRFIRTPEGIHSVVVADDGKGMDANGLREAMRFGSRSTKSGLQLGKYGIGLKSASLSQAEKVTVLSKRGTTYIGRRWTLANVKQDWTCEVLASAGIRGAFSDTFGRFRIGKSGTIIVWAELEHLKALPNHIDAVLEKTKKEILTELGIRFHRFIESGRLSISIDEQQALEEPTQLPLNVTALDPFGYERSPVSGFPISLPLAIGASKFSVQCHIWPPRTNAPNYRLGGGKVALRQGFYFYRNDRVIQAGGWNQLRGDDGEPHLSLARVKVDLPASLDSLFKLDVTKSRLDPAPAFRQALLSAKDLNGITFERFIEQAQSAYRKQKIRDRARFPVIPGKGISASAQRSVAAILKEPGVAKPLKVSFKWKKLDPDEVFRVQAGRPEIIFNSQFREEVSEGGRDDAPMLKVALMFLLQEEIGKSFSTKVSAEWLQRLNLALLASIKA